jgi:histidyl-tRNA synthetase
VGGGKSVPAVGFVYDVEQLLAAGAHPPTPSVTPLQLAPAGDSYDIAVRWAQALRVAGIAVVMVSNGAAQVIVHPDGTARLADQIFEQPDTLIAHLERVNA